MSKIIIFFVIVAFASVHAQYWNNGAWAGAGSGAGWPGFPAGFPGFSLNFPNIPTIKPLTPDEIMKMKPTDGGKVVGTYVNMNSSGGKTVTSMGINKNGETKEFKIED